MYHREHAQIRYFYFSTFCISSFVFPAIFRSSIARLKKGRSIVAKARHLRVAYAYTLSKLSQILHSKADTKWEKGARSVLDSKCRLFWPLQTSTIQLSNAIGTRSNVPPTSPSPFFLPVQLYFSWWRLARFPPFFIHFLQVTIFAEDAVAGGRQSVKQYIFEHFNSFAKIAPC